MPTPAAGAPQAASPPALHPEECAGRTSCPLACRIAVTAVFLSPSHLSEACSCSLSPAEWLATSAAVHARWPAALRGGDHRPCPECPTWSRTCRLHALHSSINLLSAHPYTSLGSSLQERRKQQDLHRRVEKVQRVVNASPEIALAGRLQRLLGAADVHVHEVEQSCIMTQWMLQEVADIGISGLRWSPAKVGAALGLLVP